MFRISYTDSLWWCKSSAHSVETILRILNFDLFWDQYVVRYCLVLLGSGNKPQLLVVTG